MEYDSALTKELRTVVIHSRSIHRRRKVLNIVRGGGGEPNFPLAVN